VHYAGIRPNGVDDECLITVSTTRRISSPPRAMKPSRHGQVPAARVCPLWPAFDHELGVLVEDSWQRRGIGTELVTRLVASARARGVNQIVADVLGEDGFVLSALRRIAPLTSLSNGGSIRSALP
jgi:GNAT superfamily N-acetyltransferase